MCFCFVSDSSKIIGMWLRNNDKTSAVANGTTYNFSEEKNITMTLRIESNPDSQLILRSSFLKTYQLNYSKSATDCKSKLPSLKCEDSGIYQIQASNGIPYGDNITVNFKIYCKYSVNSFLQLKTSKNVKYVNSLYHWIVNR